MLILKQNRLFCFMATDIYTSYACDVNRLDLMKKRNYKDVFIIFFPIKQVYM